MQISETGLNLIKSFEGLRLTVYQDPSGVWTIGYGHTASARELNSITRRQAEKLLKHDIEWAEEVVKNLVKVPLNQDQYDALVSFVFNIGESQFASSTLLRLLNSGDYKAASHQFLRWIYDNGRVFKGLKRRRAAERNLFTRLDRANESILAKIKRVTSEVFTLC